jgi:hypothetical protein
LTNDLKLSPKEIDFLLSPAAVRKRAEEIFALAARGSTAFLMNENRLKPTVDYVLRVIERNYPDLKIPFHSRWGHFRAGQVERARAIDERADWLDPLEKARCKLDLVITSVLLDAGAGDHWVYREQSTGLTLSRSEGLGVASFHLFCSGALSQDRKSMHADAEGLRRIDADDLRAAFQVSDKNPLLGVEGRVRLLNNLASAVSNRGIFRDGRPGNILDYLRDRHAGAIPASAVLRAVLDLFGPIWPGRLSAGGIPLGDVWAYGRLAPRGTFDSLVPFHKLSQWMTYSLIEPIQEAGIVIEGIDELTGLAEYRNGGLLLDSELIRLRDPENAVRSWRADSDLIIEWRALTIAWLDRIGKEVQKRLNRSAREFPLAKVLEGGTWWAGRFLAKEKRPGGEPPLKIESDGTVF